MKPGLAVIVMLALALCQSAYVKAEDAASTVDTLHLAGTVYLLRVNTPFSNPSTVASVGPDGVFLADAGFVETGPVLMSALAELGAGTIRYVATTHYHGDHAQGLEYFAPGALVIATEAQRRRLAEESVTFEADGPSLREYALPELTVDGEIRIRINGETITVFRPTASPAGHTDGDLFVHFEDANVLYVGDYLMLNGFPVIDLDGGGDIDGFLSNIASLTERYGDSTIVVAGHGSFAPAVPVAMTMKDFRAYHATLVASVEYVRRRAAQGDSAEEIIAGGLPLEFEGFNPRPNFVKTHQWITQVYEYYAAQ